MPKRATIKKLFVNPRLRRDRRSVSRAAGDGAQEEIEQRLTGGHIVGDVARGVAAGDCLDKGGEPSRGRLESAEIEGVDRGVAAHELRRVKIPSGVDAELEGVLHVAVVKPPRIMNPLDRLHRKNRR